MGRCSRNPCLKRQQHDKLNPKLPLRVCMFIKLNKNFFDIEYSQGDEAISYGGIISYFCLNDINKDILKVIPKKYQDFFSVSLLKVTDAVPPHTDSEAKTVINFYIKPGKYKTVFFDGESSTYQIPNQTNGQMYKRKDLVESKFFVAEQGNAFCLDVTKVHAVDPLEEPLEERLAICVSTGDFNFEQVCNMLVDTKYIN